jgi:hypothetical protein
MVQIGGITNANTHGFREVFTGRGLDLNGDAEGKRGSLTYLMTKFHLFVTNCGGQIPLKPLSGLLKQGVTA